MQLLLENYGLGGEYLLEMEVAIETAAGANPLSSLLVDLEADITRMAMVVPSLPGAAAVGAPPPPMPMPMPPPMRSLAPLFRWRLCSQFNLAEYLAAPWASDSYS